MLQDNRTIRAVSVYCASSVGVYQAFSIAARSLGKALAQRGITLINGGGSGLMDIITKSALAHGGDVIGIIPYAIYMSGGEKDKLMGEAEDLKKSPGTDQPCGKIIVDSMHERKVEMASRSDGFITLPGGFGTYEEVCEVITWNQISIHCKPVVILNVLNYYSGLRDQINKGIEAGLIHPSHKDIAIFVEGPENLNEHESFDWGTAALEALASWDFYDGHNCFDWSARIDNGKSDAMAST